MYNVMVARQADGYHALIAHRQGHIVIPRPFATFGEAVTEGRALFPYG
jgi:hypothetical protein